MPRGGTSPAYAERQASQRAALVRLEGEKRAAMERATQAEFDRGEVELKVWLGELPEEAAEAARAAHREAQEQADRLRLASVALRSKVPAA